jgi:molybdopterin synthase catalytic subunit/molybdopterin converting factor small subunit
VRLEVKLFAVLAERAGAASLVLEDLDAGLSVGELKLELARRHPELGSLEYVAGVLGTSYAPDSRTIAEGDEVAFLPPVSGGAPDYERGEFLLSAEPLDAGALSMAVQHDSCGAVVTFTGLTRERNREQDVARLDYEAFEAMTGPEMQRIFSDCLALHGPAADPEAEPAERALRMLCAHRTGVVGVGEPSVVIAVASPHRDAAFQAARYLIDTLKERLPVWKKEVYADGHHWIGDRS